MPGAKKTIPKKRRDQRDSSPKKEEPKKEITKSMATSIVEPKVLEQIRKEVPKMKYVTPYQLYSKYNIRYSVSKDILESMANQGSLKLAKSTRRVDIYVPA
jgi:small subunit ribosomal protein S25e